MDLFGGPVISPEVAAKEAKWDSHREECLARFNKAVAASKGRDHRLSEAIIESVRAKHGDRAAEIASSELKKAIRHEGKTKK